MENDRAGYQAAPAANAIDGLVPVAEAAAAAGVPLRTAYTWLKQKKLATVQRRAGRRLVSVAELRALRDGAAASSAGTVPASAGTGSGAPGIATRPAVAGDGVLEGRVAAMLDEGFDESLIVQQLQIPFAKVLAVAAAWRSARQSHVIATRLDVVEERLEAMSDRISGAETALAILPEHLDRRDAVLAELQRLVRAMYESWYGAPCAELARPLAPLRLP